MPKHPNIVQWLRCFSDRTSPHYGIHLWHKPSPVNIWTTEDYYQGKATNDIIMITSLQ